MSGSEGKIFTYLPASIIGYLQHLEDVKEEFKTPATQTFTTSVLFADVSGFTALCEQMAKKGPAGDEHLAEHLNSYFGQLVKTISSQGGDVFKFAGDAILVIWPPDEQQHEGGGDLMTCTRRAFQCALEISRKLQNAELAEGVTLNVKIGVGIGEVKILHVGGVYDRVEYVAVGKSLVQAFASEHHCDSTYKIFASPPAWALAGKYFIGEEKEDGFVYLKDCPVSNVLRKVNITSLSYEAIQPYVARDQEFWAGELRLITVLFVNVGMEEGAMQDVNYVHKVLKAVQSAVYKFEGSLNKFLMDDKGSTLLAAFGLPPLAHENDATRGVVSAMEIYTQLKKMGLRASVGITTGSAYCGVIGPRTRREYSILGDTVNLAARLMQAVHKEFTENPPPEPALPIFTDTATQYAARESVTFRNQGRMKVKGKQHPIQFFRPDFSQKSNPVPRKMTSKIYSGHSRSRYQTPSSMGQSRTISGSDLSIPAISEESKDAPVKEPVQEEPLSPVSPTNADRKRSMTHDAPPKSSKPSIEKMRATAYATASESDFHSMSASRAKLEALQAVQHRRRSLGDLLETRQRLKVKPLGLALVLLQRDLSTSFDLALVDTVYDIKQIVFEAFPHTKESLPKEYRLWAQTDDKMEALNDAQKINELSSSWFRFWERGTSAPAESIVIVFHMLPAGSIPPYSQMRRSREIILQSIHNVTEGSRKGLVIVEGDIGLGKSYLLASCVTKATVPIISAKASPLTAQNNFSVWKEVMWNLLDFEIAENAEKYTQSEPTARRAALVQKLLEELPSSSQVSSAYVMAAVGEVLELDLAPVQDDSRAGIDTTSLGEKREHLNRLEKGIVVLLQQLTRLRPRVLALDDASWMDPMSWRLCVAVVKDVQGLLLILLTRPLNKSTLGAFMEYPKEFTHLVKLPATVRIRITPRPDDEIYRMACDAIPGLQQQGLPGALGNFILRKACGNPLIVKELMYDMVKQKLVTVSEDGEVKVSPTFNTNARDRIPHSLKTALGSRLDRLTRLQSMVLKVGAIQGDEFTKDVVSKSYPFSVNTEKDEFFANELKTLKKLNVITLVDPVDETYCFTQGFMRELLLSRMLESQRSKLKEKVQGVTSKHMARRSLLSKDVKAKMEGVMGVRLDDTRGTSYPEKYFALKQRMLCYWDSQASYEDKGSAQGMLPLRNARVMSDRNGGRTIQICCETWFRDGSFEDSDMTFTLEVDSDESFQRWVEAIQETMAEIMQSQNMSPTMISTLRKMSQEQSSSERSVLEHHHEKNKKSISAEQVTKLQQNMQTMLDSSRTVVKSQLLNVMKQEHKIFADNWKRRWLTLSSDPPLLWLHRRHVENIGKGAKTASKFVDDATQIINLSVGFVKVSYLGASQNKKNKSFAVRVEFQLWTKRRSMKWDRRRMTFACASEEDAQGWADQIQHVIQDSNPIYRSKVEKITSHAEVRESPMRRKRASSWDLASSPSWSHINEKSPSGSNTPAQTYRKQRRGSGDKGHESSDEDDGTFVPISEDGEEFSEQMYRESMGIVAEENDDNTVEQSKNDVFVV
eukprot:g800.t1